MEISCSKDDIEITLCYAVNSQLIYFCTVIKAYEEEDICHSIILQWKPGEWKCWPVETRIVGICAFEVNGETIVIASGFDGSIHKTTKDGFEWETIGTGPEMPSTLRRISNLKLIDSYIYAVGMARQVFRRPKAKYGKWQRYDQGALIPKSEFEINGFSAIDGFDDEMLYAVGFHGHIWHCENGLWRQIDSPTNLKLTCLKCIDDKVIVGGNNGILLEGAGDHWKPIVQDLTGSCFRFIDFFKNQIFLTTEKGELFGYNGEELFKEDISIDGIKEIYTLNASDDILVAAGSQNIVYYDGANWSKLYLPF